MDSDPIVLGISRQDLDGDFLGSFGGKPLYMILIVQDPNPEQCMPLLDLAHRIPQHLLGDIPLDPGDHGYDGKG
jgi:hypothetical protein